MSVLVYRGTDGSIWAEDFASAFSLLVDSDGGKCQQRPFAAYKGSEPYIFVSYAHADAEVVYPELARLKDQGFNVYYDEGISPGSTWQDALALAITQCRVFLFYVSPRSAASSNCKDEVSFAISREKHVVAVHLEETDMPPGLEMSLGTRQAIIRGDHSESAYQTKLVDSLRSLMPRPIEPLPLPQAQPVAADESDKKSLAILPFANRNLDPDNDYLCDGIAEELITGFSKIDGLKVTTRSDSFGFKGKQVSTRKMGEELNVENVLTGSIQKSGNRVRISVGLEQVSSGSNLWSERYDGTLDDIFELQEDVARQVIDALKVELGADEDIRLVDTGTQSSKAYDLFLLANHDFSKGTVRGLAQAIEYLEQATRLDPDWGQAYRFLFDCCRLLMTVFGQSREELGPKAMAAATRAKELGINLDWVEVQRSIDPSLMPTTVKQAEEACAYIVNPDPDRPAGHGYPQLADCLMGAGLFQAGIK